MGKRSSKKESFKIGISEGLYYIAIMDKSRTHPVRTTFNPQHMIAGQSFAFQV